MNLSKEELDLVRQWFDAVQESNESFLVKEDYQLYAKICNDCGWRVPNSIKDKIDV